MLGRATLVQGLLRFHGCRLRGGTIDGQHGRLRDEHGTGWKTNDFARPSVRLKLSAPALPERRVVGVMRFVGKLF